MCITRGEKIDKREKIACCFSFLFFFLILLLLLLFEHYYLLLLDFLITPFYKRYICWWSSLVLVSFKTKKIVRRHGISKILSSSPFVNSFFLFCFFLFFSFFFFLSLAETDDQSSLITESFDMVVQLEVLFGGEWRGEIVRTCY